MGRPLDFSKEKRRIFYMNSIVMDSEKSSRKFLSTDNIKPFKVLYDYINNKFDTPEKTNSFIGISRTTYRRFIDGELSYGNARRIRNAYTTLKNREMSETT